jgi:hypothetical protein
METATQGTEQVFKRGRGRPRVEEGEQAWYVRGPKKRTVDRLLKALNELCNGDRKKVNEELDKLLSRRADEIMSDEAVIERADKEIAAHTEKVGYFQGLRDAAAKRLEERRKYTVDSPEVQAAIRVQVDLTCGNAELLARREEFLEQDAVNIARRFPGAHWQQVKQALRRAVQERVDEKLRRRGGGAQ